MGDWFSDDKATFGDRLAGAREAMGLSQEEAARRLGITAKTLRAWEDDLREPRANQLQMIAGLLGVSLMWLMTGEGEGAAPPETAQSPDKASALADLRMVRAEIARLAERVGHIEKRLREA